MRMSLARPSLASCPATADGALRVSVESAGDAAFARLRAVEAGAAPFQSAGWIRAYLETHETMAGFRLVTLADDGGASLVLPLMLAQRGPLRFARKIGGAHASFFFPAQTGDASGWSAARLRAALKAAGAMAGFDALLLADCPREWHGQAHPLLALGHAPSPSSGAMLTIGTAGVAILETLFDKDARKKQRYKRRKLGEIGTLGAGWAPCSESLETALDAFFGWKARQFAALGIPDPFATPAMRAFIIEACCGSAPVARLFTLTLDDRPIAVIGTTGTGKHVSGMFTAYDPDPAVARFSPGDLLLADLLPVLAAEGRAGFDLGVGEARYKSHFCPEPLEMVDFALPCSVTGAIAARTWLTLRAARRFVKRRPRLYDLAMRGRRLLPR